MTYKDFIEKISIAAKHTLVKGYVEERRITARNLCTSIGLQYGTTYEPDSGCGYYYYLMYNGIPIAEVIDGGDGTIARASLAIRPMSTYYPEIDIQDTELGEAAVAMEVARRIRLLESLRKDKEAAMAAFEKRILEEEKEIRRLVG